MASVKRIEGLTVHRIQSGQVVVDLSSAVKELVENSIDAGSTSVDIRFKNYGLDAIEVQDDGSGIAREDFESIALKHYTSKLSTFDDLQSLNTYGFRGEALSSLCAVSDLYITTARQDEAPQGSRIDFESSGSLKSTTVVACQRGTTVHVEKLFRNLIVRRKELEKNVKREYTRALNLLQAYACICTDLRLSVSNTVAKQRKDVFRTRGNQGTRDNIANVFGAKSLAGLIELDLKFKMTSSGALPVNDEDNTVRVVGHVSTPTYGGGRQTSDRQMFFVNSRPCSLPQFAKVFNEVYKSYNMSQSPFVFANIILDTNAYDVNVSPDKRTIMLHDQNEMLDSIRHTLTELFEKQQQSVPSAAVDRKLPSYKALTISRESTLDQPAAGSTTLSRTTTVESDSDEEDGLSPQRSQHLISDFAARGTRLRPETKVVPNHPTEKQRAIMKLAKEEREASDLDELDDVSGVPGARHVQRPTDDGEEEDDDLEASEPTEESGAAAHVRAFNERLAEIKARNQASRGHTTLPTLKYTEPATNDTEEDPIPSVTTSPAKDITGALPNAFDRIRPMRMQAETATITIGDKTITTVLGSRKPTTSRNHLPTTSARDSKALGGSLKAFMAPGSRNDDQSTDEDDSVVSEAPPEDSISSHPHRRNEQKIQKLDGKQESTLGADDSGQEDVIDGSGLSSDSADDDSGHLRASSTASAEEMDNSDDEDYHDEESNKAKNDARVSKLIGQAEASMTATPTTSHARNKTLSRRSDKDCTVKLNLNVSVAEDDIARQALAFTRHSNGDSEAENTGGDMSSIDDPLAESQLSINVSKSDFTRMRIVGQFNLGFIIAVRPKVEGSHGHLSEEIFIIDQHASDEKYNFERLQQITTLKNQQLVQPQTLDLTAVEEEILSNNATALQANGFQISIDESGAAPVGRRCTLHALPTSREVTFTTTDLEELISLLAVSDDNDIMPTSTISQDGRFIPRPSKVRKLFAMRACRSSIMIGKTLTKPQMSKLVQNMGTIDKPWNCPHGRPTMRHLRTLGGIKQWMGQGSNQEVGDDIDWEGWL